MENASRVHSWISNITRHNVKGLDLCLRLDKTFFIPSSLFKYESLTKLELSASCNIHIPKSFSFPKPKSLTLSYIRFTEDDGWNEQHFSNCPVLESLFLDDCTWFGSRKFCILTPALKVLEIYNYSPKEDGLQDYDLKIHAPDLESIVYWNVVAKDYDLSSFVKLVNADIYFSVYDGEERIGHGEERKAVSKFLRALAHVKSLIIATAELEAVLFAEDYVNILPTFNNPNKLDLTLGPASDELIFALLKAAPNLKKLRFNWDIFGDDDDDDNDDTVYNETDDDLFGHLQSVLFRGFVWRRGLRWAKLILKTAKSLQKMTIRAGNCFLKEKELVEPELQNLPRASLECVLSKTCDRVIS
ncbi:F-box/LRR-repeat protein At4g14096-like [Papaver somniferum]|uniref:F-box/LRR-repeat protein At4g14096-like n=1 Tax=Papaver somniferum TaxID=3469 RepID=UPI000E700E80|nr:F-box/LRR-repeat protein At4g14096-like [Papaver somniferum]